MFQKLLMENILPLAPRRQVRDMYVPTSIHCHHPSGAFSPIVTRQQMATGSS